MKIGVVGLDTSHSPMFTKMLNDSEHEYHIPGFRVIGAYPGGSEAFSLSRNRVRGYTEELRAGGVRMYDSIPGLVRDVDAVLLESVDGSQHLEQFRQMAVGKPVFVDKPFATSTADAQAIVDLADKTGTPLMSSSSLRYAAGIADLVAEGEKVVCCEAFGPAAILEDYPGLFWYGIHSAEMLFAFMGQGCRAARCIEFPAMDVVIGQWQDGRQGILRGTRFEKGPFGCVVHTDQGVRMGVAKTRPTYYSLLMEQIAEFFKTGTPPIDIQETLNIIAFLQAANQSKAQGGQVIAIAYSQIR